MQAKLTLSIDDLEQDADAMNELIEEFVDEPEGNTLEDNVKQTLQNMWTQSKERFMREFGTDLELDDVEVHD